MVVLHSEKSYTDSIFASTLWERSYSDFFKITRQELAPNNTLISGRTRDMVSHITKKERYGYRKNKQCHIAAESL
jgi:hypothetical protein